jgi:hypothetical protein
VEWSFECHDRERCLCPEECTISESAYSRNRRLSRKIYI